MVRITTSPRRSGSGCHQSFSSLRKKSVKPYAAQRPLRSWCELSVEVKGPDGRHTKQSTDKEHAPVIEFDCAFATDTPGDRNRRITMLIATADSIPKSVFSCVTRRQGV